ncbi:MAG: hypothetical protein KDD44_11135, partial [Bdellovibrionales bacterium]|nr:hypothetical protein [Bdellovibrionales bacterium]
ELILVANVIATAFMLGLIWFIQLVHYKLYSAVGRDQFPFYERRHCFLIAFIVLPVMSAELGTAYWLWWRNPWPELASIFQLGLVLVGVNWTSTMLVQTPVHNRLLKEFTERDYRLLLRSNWVRTASWSLRSGLMAVAVAILLVGR